MNATPSRHRSVSPSHDRVPQVLLGAYIIVWVLTALKPLNRQDWVLENVLVVAAVPLLIFTYPKFRFSNFSYVLITVYLTLHAIGAHYTYTEMPLFNWLRDGWQFSRNHYDRLVHFLFGLMIACPLWEMLVRVVGLRRGWARVGTVHVIMAWSALYEIIEATVAQVVSPELGAAYNGIQGDIWDAQKDAALAMAGAILCMAVTVPWQSRLLSVRPIQGVPSSGSERS